MVESGISSDSGSVAELVIGLRNSAGDCTHQYSSQTAMNDSNSVLMTSLVPTLIFRMPAIDPQSMPATAAANSGIMNGKPAGKPATPP